MELRILAPIVLGLVAVVMFIVAEWRVTQRGMRVAIAGLSLVVLAIAVWDFKNLERRWEQHLLLHSAGQSLLSIELMLERGEQAKVLQVLKKWEEEGALYHLDRAKVQEIQGELSKN